MTLDDNVWLSSSDMKILSAVADNVPEALIRLGLALSCRDLGDQVIDLMFSLDDDGAPLVGAVLEDGEM